MSTLLLTIFSIANHYVILFHGNPLFYSEFINIGAALDVMHAYSFSFDNTVLIILAFAIFEIGLIFIFSQFKKMKEVKRYFDFIESKFNRITITIIETVVVMLFIVLIAAPKITLSWNKLALIREDGFCFSFIADIDNVLHPCNEPKGYSAGFNVSDSGIRDDSDNVKPDIVLILNETFFNLYDYCGIKTDKNYINSFYNIDNAAYGYAEVPSTGGGTNDSEFELLTSNSMALLKTGSPFNYYDFKKNKTNSIQYLNTLGYKTYAFHCGAPSTYSRNNAFPNMGFKNYYLGKENFTFNRYGNRAWRDEDNYEDLIRIYQSVQSGPNFMYLLTFQNHGGYNQNHSKYDNVHSLDDYGAINDELNEYITSVKHSADAFNKLVSYFKTSSRPVIICMVGDHAPSFITQIASDEKFGNESISRRLVPYVVWSNYKNIESVPYYSSLVDVMPIVFKQAGLNLSDYYKKILEINSKIPIRTSDGLYVDVNNNLGEINNNEAISNLLNEYYYMEYNSLVEGENLRKELFTPNDTE